MPSALNEGVARMIDRAFRAGQGVLAADVRQLKQRMTALEHANPDHAPPLPVDFDELRRAVDRSGR